MIKGVKVKNNLIVLSILIVFASLFAWIVMAVAGESVKIQTPASDTNYTSLTAVLFNVSFSNGSDITNPQNATFSINVQTPVWCLKDLNWIPSQAGSCSGEGDQIAATPFSRQATFNLSTVTDPDGATKDIVEVDVSVSWEDSSGSHVVTSATNFADWRQR